MQKKKRSFLLVMVVVLSTMTATPAFAEEAMAFPKPVVLSIGSMVSGISIPTPAPFATGTQATKITSVEPVYQPASVSQPETKPASSTPPATPEQKPTEVAKPTESTTTPAPAQSGHTFDMNDPNVKLHPIYATAKTAAELQAGSSGWRTAAEIIAEQKRNDPDYLIDGKTFYEWRMAPIVKWLDAYCAENGLSYVGKTDYEKTAIIAHVFASGKSEEFIGLWRNGFAYARDASGNIDYSKDCVPRAEAQEFMMVAFGFELFQTVTCDTGSPLDHAIGVYRDSTVALPRFLDPLNAMGAGSGVWNVYVDELDELGYKLY